MEMSTAVGSYSQQRMVALGRANEVRSLRAIEKRKISRMTQYEACLHVAGMVSEPCDWAGTWRLGDFMLEIPKFGKVRIGRMLRKYQIKETVTLDGMTPRQRDAVIGYLQSGCL